MNAIAKPLTETVATEPVKIAASGAYDLPNEIYHSDCCAGPSISPSSVKEILSDPSEYWRKSYLNPDAEPREGKQAFNVGTAAHTLVLEPELLHDTIAVVPGDYLASNGALSTKKAKEFVAEQTELGRTVIKPDEWDAVCSIADNVRAHPQVVRSLARGRVEQSLILKDDETGIFLKARPDFMPDESDRFIVDLKTTDRTDIAGWEKSALADLRYDIQAAVMMVVMREVTGIKPAGVLYIVTCKQPPYRVGVRVLRPASDIGRTLLDAGWADTLKAMRIFAECWQTATWPSPWDAVSDIAPPEFVMRQADRNIPRDFESPFGISGVRL